MELLATLGECACKELGYYAGATSATLRRLEKLELLTLREQEVLPPPPPAAAADPKPLLLTPQQQAAYDSLSARLQDASPGTALRYGARVAVLHSALRISERYETWKRIRSGDADVVLGTRSAVFAPVRDLGLLIVDEEQEHTYQSENAPRYHAREVAIYRGAQEHALTVLGSATPTVESMYRAVTGAFGLCRMTERYNGRPLPPVEIVDMKRELREGNASIISEPLLLALRENLRLGQQSILYLNRRGTSRMLACVECGSVPMCPGCSLPLTYHHANGRLMCHICGHSEPVPARCPVCGGHLRQIGSGSRSSCRICCPASACCAWMQTPSRQSIPMKSCSGASARSASPSCLARRWWQRDWILKTSRSRPCWTPTSRSMRPTIAPRRRRSA